MGKGKYIEQFMTNVIIFAIKIMFCLINIINIFNVGIQIIYPLVGNK